jgi:hypothetical protein
MSSSFDAFAFEKIAKGFEVLVEGGGCLRDRLAGAWDAGIWATLPEMMPTPELEGSLARIHAFFTSGSGHPEMDAIYVEYHGVAWASVRRRRYETLRPVASQIWDLYDRLGRHVRGDD